MAVIALGSAKGAPGVTTTALALTMNWPRPAVLVEADLAGASVFAGFFRSQLALDDVGLGQIAIAHSRGELDQAAVWAQTRPLNEDDPDHRVLPGIPTVRVATTLRAGAWPALAEQLAEISQGGGVDVIVDLGRMAPNGDDREALISRADLVLVVTGSRMPDTWATRGYTTHVMSTIAPDLRPFTPYRVLTIGPGRPVRTGTIESLVGLPSVGEVAWDPVSAEVFSDGAKASKRFVASPLGRTIPALIDNINQAVATRRERVAGGPFEGAR